MEGRERRSITRSDATVDRSNLIAWRRSHLRVTPRGLVSLLPNVVGYLLHSTVQLEANGRNYIVHSLNRSCSYLPDIWVLQRPQNWGHTRLTHWQPNTHIPGAPENPQNVRSRDRSFDSSGAIRVQRYVSVEGRKQISLTSRS
jgi:hypothetical protein